MPDQRLLSRSHGDEFNPSRLTLARKRRGMTKVRLAKEAHLSTRSISAYERGDMPPSETTSALLARVLRFPVAFLSGPDIDEPTPDIASFRALSSMTAAQRDASLAAGALAIELSRWIDERFALPPPNVPDFRGYEPEAAAASLRARWGLGERPVRNMIHVLEAQGVRVFSLTEECVDVDAFSFWKAGTPFVFLNTMKSGERSRFDAAHELGHLVLHRHGGPIGNDGQQARGVEREADAFASAFLMPRSSILAAAPRLPNVDRLIKLKKTWNVAVSALAHRLRALDMLSEWQYRMLCMEIAQRGFKTTEPDGIPRETSQVLNKVFAVMREEGTSKADVAHQLRLHTFDLEALVFGLVTMTSISGGRSDGGTSPPRGQLRLV
jgi:Zn-dependent peptidase ImmA (M78 family)/DNA-binding XRE family transcriptional regulator